MLSLNIPPWKLFRGFRRLQLRATGDWQFHHDNVLAHVSHLVQGFFAKYQITQVTQLPLQPRFGALWLLAFPKTKTPLKEKRFQTVGEIQGNMPGQPMAMPTKDFAECLEQWKRCWANCVRSQGAYFDGDWGIIVLGTMFLLSSSVNVCISHSARLDTFWTDSNIIPEWGFNLHSPTD